MKVIRADCPKCGKWAEGFDVVQVLFGFYRKNRWVVPNCWCKECKSKKRDDMREGYLLNKRDIDLQLLDLVIVERPKKTKKVKLDIFEGLTDKQMGIVKFMVESRSCSPFGFRVKVEENRIFYMGKEVLA